MLSKFVDKVKISTLVYLFIGGILFCWIAFYFLTPVGHGIVSTTNNEEEIKLFDAFYFSVVTVSSLGYGDFRPVAGGRVLAIIEVVYGLVLLALIVSKLASDKTSSLIKILYSSDLERRLRSFIVNTDKLNQRFVKAISDHDHEAVGRLALDFKTVFSNRINYITYQYNGGALEGDWADRLMLRILRKTIQSVTLANKAIRSIKNDADNINRLDNLVKRAKLLSEVIANKFEYSNIQKVGKQIFKQAEVFNKHKKAFETNSKKFNCKRSTVLTENLLERVLESMPPKPWKKHLHKDIASNLKISNRLAVKSISELIERGRIKQS